MYHPPELPVNEFVSNAYSENFLNHVEKAGETNNKVAREMKSKWIQQKQQELDAKKKEEE